MTNKDLLTLNRTLKNEQGNFYTQKWKMNFCSTSSTRQVTVFGEVMKEDRMGL